MLSEVCQHHRQDHCQRTPEGCCSESRTPPRGSSRRRRTPCSRKTGMLWSAPPPLMHELLSRPEPSSSLESKQKASLPWSPTPSSTTPMLPGKSPEDGDTWSLSSPQEPAVAHNVEYSCRSYQLLLNSHTLYRVSCAGKIIPNPFFL